MLGGAGDSPSQPNFMQPDMGQITQMLENPAMQSIMSSVLSNPDVLDEFINSNPAIRQMIESNPQLRESIRNPQFLSQLTNPQVNYSSHFKSQRVVDLVDLESSLVM